MGGHTCWYLLCGVEVQSRSVRGGVADILFLVISLEVAGLIS